MIFQVILYEGSWTKKVSEKIVRRLLQKRFYCSTSNVSCWAQPDEIIFQRADSDVLCVAEISLYVADDMDYELIIDELYSRFFSLGPEYESMVEIILVEEIQ